MYGKEHSQQVEENYYFHLLSTSESTSVELCVVLDTPVQEGHGMLQRSQQRDMNMIEELEHCHTKRG